MQGYGRSPYNRGTPVNGGHSKSNHLLRTTARSYLRRRVTGRPAFWRAFIKPVNASPASSVVAYSSSFSSGNSSTGDSPSSNWNERERSLTRPLGTRRVFTLPNEPRISRHRMWSPSLLFDSRDIESLPYLKVRYTTADNTVLSWSEICTADATCHSKLVQPTRMKEASSAAPSRGYSLT